MRNNGDVPRRPNCNGIFKFSCRVCCKDYVRSGAHAKCYQRYCHICTRVLSSPEELKDHLKTYHKRNQCRKCRKYINPIKEHMAGNYCRRVAEAASSSEYDD
jgi:hypothetical protein